MTGKTGFCRTGLFARFRRHERGATAVEFAMVAAPFFALFMGIMELGLIFLASVSLDNSVQSAARQIRTGQLKEPDTTGMSGAAAAAATVASSNAFKNTVCEGMRWMVDNCKANLTVDVRTFTQFQNVTYNDPITNKVFNPGSTTFETGGPSNIVLVRAYYRWTLFVPVMSKALERTAGQTLLTSVTTFRNEPF